MKVKIHLVNPLAKIPFKATEGSACYDVYATSREFLNGGKIVKYGLGFRLEPTMRTRIDFRPRSSVWRTGLILCNCIGTGDEDFRGEYAAYFYHVVPKFQPYNVGDRILQMSIETRHDIEFEENDELSETERGSGGFGSTGIK